MCIFVFFLKLCSKRIGVYRFAVHFLILVLLITLFSFKYHFFNIYAKNFHFVQREKYANALLFQYEFLFL